MVERFIFKQLYLEKDSHKVSVVLGPRQVGKTTVLRQLHKKLGGLFFDVDLISEYKQVSSYENFLASLKLKGYKEDQNEKFYVFLDEFQRYKDLSLVIKNIYDHHQNIKIYATGSSSLMIKNAVQDSLAGRKFISYLYPLCFEEVLLFRNLDAELDIYQNMKAEKLKVKDLSVSCKSLIAVLDEVLSFGAYPEVVLVSNSEMKKKTLASIFDLYVKKDIRDYLQLNNIDSVRILVELLAVNNAKELNYSNYSSIIGLDDKTTKHYIEVLKETFLLNILKPFYTNKNKEISKTPKAYFMDTGMRNFFIDNFTEPRLRNDKGHLFETFYIAELLKAGHEAKTLKYFRTKSRIEVDIIIDKLTQQIPIELKYTNQIKNSQFNGLKYFMTEYKQDKAYLVNTLEQSINSIAGIELIAPWTLV